MILCKDCKHWAPRDAGSEGTCKRITTYFACGEPMPADRIAMIETDESDEYVSLDTRPEFGCVLGEPK